MSAPTWAECDAEARATVVRDLEVARDNCDACARSTLLPGDVTAKYARRRAAFDAALARLAEPDDAAERWRAVPDHAREAMLAELEHEAASLTRGAFGVNAAGKPWADHAAAAVALLALARLAEIDEAAEVLRLREALRLCERADGGACPDCGWPNRHSRDCAIGAALAGAP